ncbi:UvrD-helicase domain-containing protein [Vibrio sp. 10N.239.311.G01]|uniref:UvrD-helicase domain-containing protein n=1 Tax=Vibrio sp. 10N.239.311.G01 TaxID=3229976 RepID=UPI00354DFACF
MAERIQTDADTKVATCLAEKRSFAMIAGAGAGKTSSLVEALELIRREYGSELRINGQRVACITFTKRAVQVISGRLGDSDLFVVSTLHSFLWGEIKTFTYDIRKALVELRIPELISKEREKDNGGRSQRALKAREKVAYLESELELLSDTVEFKYDDARYSEYSKGKLSHDDVIELAGYLLNSKPAFRKAFGYRYPYFFVDEAQDTFPIVVESFQSVASGTGLPVLGFFGDPWQQIYEKRAGDFRAPDGGVIINKTENFRCSTSVISFLNRFRNDLEQYAAGENKHKLGSVKITLVQTESPEEPRNKYSEAQIDRSLERMDQALTDWGWIERTDVVKLFLVRQMIARRLGFVNLHRLFTGRYASATAQEGYESGNHFLLKPIISSLWPLLEANRSGNVRRMVELLSSIGPAFKIDGKNRSRPLKEMVEHARNVVNALDEIWTTGTLKQIYEYCLQVELIDLPERVVEHLARQPRTEEFSEAEFGLEKGDWLCDEFFAMKTTEFDQYFEFIRENTNYSTQHGVKGEEYPDVLVVLDDVEAAWNQYNFSKLLTPDTSGEPSEGQQRRGEKLAYVSFSRAEDNLRILFFTSNPNEAKNELLRKGLFCAEDISVILLA